MTSTVSLVIPGKNCAETVGRCLKSVVPMLHSETSPLREIIFVNDGSTDDTPRIVDTFSDVQRIDDVGRGPGAARNAGARIATGDVLWFMDSDCTAEPDAMPRLLDAMADPAVGGAAGTFGVQNPGNLLAKLVHEEIAARHAQMSEDVDYLASGHVMYRRDIFESLGGFDETYRTAEDADMAYRVKSAGHALRFQRDSVVQHFHYERLSHYLRGQRLHGRYRVRLHLAHRHTAGGDAYASLVDYAQPPLALLVVLTLPLLLLPLLPVPTPLALAGASLPAFAALLLLLAQLPMTIRLVRRTDDLRMVMYAPFGWLRSFWRAFGMAEGMMRLSGAGPRGSAP
jgi:glycosyltransferase involved in cell wall biosynthesis